MSQPQVESIECHVFRDATNRMFDPSGREVLARNPDADYYLNELGRVDSRNYEAGLVKVTTDDGCHGWGELMAPMAPEVGVEIIETLVGPMIIGADPLNVENLRDRMYNSMNIRGHTTGFMIDAVSALDIALWDLKGKLLDAPVSALLGGRRRETLPAYANLGEHADPESQAAAARERVDEGYDAIKVYFGRHNKGVERETLQAIRDEIGFDRQVVTDLYWNYSVPEVTRAGRGLQELDVGWIEAPLDPEDIAGHAEVARSLDVAVAVGEPLRTAYQFGEWLERDALNIAQPDVVRTGITEAKRIADLAEAFHRPVAPHISASLGVGMAATWHVSAAIPNFQIQEHHPKWLAVTDEFIEPELVCMDGRLSVPDGPGLGVDVDEDTLAPYVDESVECTESF